MIVKGQKGTQLSNDVSLGETAAQPFSCYTPPLSSRLIKKFHHGFKQFSSHLQKRFLQNACLYLTPPFHSFATLQFFSLLLPQGSFGHH